MATNDRTGDLATNREGLLSAASEMLRVLQSIDFSATHLTYDDVPFAQWEQAIDKAKGDAAS